MHKKPEITRLIHENFWIVLSFALARPHAGEILRAKFHDHFKYMHKSIYEMAEIRADRALLEMATQLRVLDDIEGINDILMRRKGPPFGCVIQGDDTVTDLHFRDVTNKIMHAGGFEWRLDDPADPIVVCLPHGDEKRWKRAEIHLLALMMGCIGDLAF